MNPEQEIGPAEKVVGDLQKNFKIVGTHRVHSWYAWAMVGIVFGMALGVIYVANRSSEQLSMTFSSAAVCSGPVNPDSYVGQGEGSVQMSPEDFNIYLSRHGGIPNPEGKDDLSVIERRLKPAQTAARAACFSDLTGKRVATVDTCVAKCTQQPSCSLSINLPPDNDTCFDDNNGCTEANGTVTCTASSLSESVDCSCGDKVGVSTNALPIDGDPTSIDQQLEPESPGPGEPTPPENPGAFNEN